MKRSPITVPSEPLTFPLRQAARQFPDKVAVISPEAEGKETTYRQLEEQSSILAASLVDLGVAPGDRVALWMKNGVEYILSFYGILKAGAVVVPISTHYGHREVSHQLTITQARGLLAQEGLIGALGDSASRTQNAPLRGLRRRGDLPSGAVSFSSLMRGSTRLDRSIGIDPEQTLAVLPSSSGTTGLPKGVMLTHANLLSNLYQIIQAHEVSDGDLLINQLPFFIFTA